MEIYFLIFFLLVLNIPLIFSFRCDRRPYSSTTRSSAPDGRFKLVVVDAQDTYIPDQLYTVKITETDEESRFTAFVISAEGDIKPDPNNPRRMIALSPGEIRPQDPMTAKFSDRCLYSVEQAMSSAKSSVELGASRLVLEFDTNTSDWLSRTWVQDGMFCFEFSIQKPALSVKVYWQAPPSGNGCITLRAMVAENEQVWYEDGTPLTARLCEDTRQPDDATPQLNYECNICDEAKYEVSFTGIWSRNTHPIAYPENDWVPHYSDLVGASHAAEYILWAPGTLASDGLKDLAEYANSSKLETEIKEKIGDGVRTLIKGKGHGYKKMNNPSYGMFRVDKVNHLVSVAVALYPSPDWFLGVTRFELCSTSNTWLQERELSLYPWDAGTDNGVSYESPNIQTFPQDAVSRVQMSSYDKNSPFYELDMKDIHPFGKLNIKLIRTYHRECSETPVEGEAATGEDVTEPSEENPEEPEEPSRYLKQDGDQGREDPIVIDPESPEECPMSQWQEWSPCEGSCVDGKVTGYQWRERYHLVDGVAIEKYDPDSKSSSRKSVSEYCKKSFETFERNECVDDCSEENEETEAERRVMEPISPGHGWMSKKRDLPMLVKGPINA